MTLNTDRSKRLEKLFAARKREAKRNVSSEGYQKETSEFHFESMADAMDFCRKLRVTGKADLFRGQNRDWPKILPSIFRMKNGSSASGRLDRFLGWARSVPQMAVYRSSTPALTAIAQHYGIPTSYLDVTSDLDIAFLFAKTSSEVGAERRESVVYCFLESALEAIPSSELLRIDVANLWRLQAQRGLFLGFRKPSVAHEVRKIAIKLYFPSQEIEASEIGRLYPVRKSALEIVIDQWMYRHVVEQTIADMPIPKKLTARRQTYPGAFRWRIVPELKPDWISSDPGWFIPPVEPVPDDKNGLTVFLSGIDVSSPFLAKSAVSAVIAQRIAEARSTGRHLVFNVQLSHVATRNEVAVSTLLNRCWDGLRVLPYSSDEIVSSLSLIAAFLIARAEMIVDVDKWPEQLWGAVELVDIAPVGGFLETACVSTEDLSNALSIGNSPHLVGWIKELVDLNPRNLMRFVVDPWMLFDFKSLKNIFLHQFLPTAIDAFWKEDLQENNGSLGCLWSASFNPAFLGFVTQGDYRFVSDFAYEKNVERTVYVFPEMERKDIEEAFISCVPSIHAHSEPFQVKFTGYSSNSYEIWEIERVAEQARMIVETGGISVLEMATSLKDEQGRSIRRKKQLQRHGDITGGLGALEIWLISKKMFPPPKHQDWATLYDKFWSDLMNANKQIDAIAHGAQDWPGTAVS